MEKKKIPFKSTQLRVHVKCRISQIAVKRSIGKSDIIEAMYRLWMVSSEEDRARAIISAARQRKAEEDLINRTKE